MTDREKYHIIINDGQLELLITAMMNSQAKGHYGAGADDMLAADRLLDALSVLSPASNLAECNDPGTPLPIIHDMS